jgi:hypothetical protein
MPLIILSNSNWRVAKAALHTGLPHIRSSHLAEAMASGLDSLTHAALGKRLRDDGERPHLQRLSDADFVRRLGELGYPDVASGYFDRAFSADAMPHAPYTFFRQGDRAANDRHYHFCNRIGRPMVMVRMARRYAELEWDCITVDPAEEDDLHDLPGNQLARIMFNLFQARAKGAPGKPLFFGSAFAGTVKKLLPATARQLAEDYFQLLYGPLLESRSPRRRAA